MLYAYRNHRRMFHNYVAIMTPSLQHFFQSFQTQLDLFATTLHESLEKKYSNGKWDPSNRPHIDEWQSYCDRISQETQPRLFPFSSSVAKSLWKGDETMEDLYFFFKCNPDAPSYLVVEMTCRFYANGIQRVAVMCTHPILAAHIWQAKNFDPYFFGSGMDVDNNYFFKDFDCYGDAFEMNGWVIQNQWREMLCKREAGEDVTVECRNNVKQWFRILVWMRLMNIDGRADWDPFFPVNEAYCYLAKPMNYEFDISENTWIRI